MTFPVHLAAKNTAVKEKINILRSLSEFLCNHKKPGCCVTPVAEIPTFYQHVRFNFFVQLLCNQGCHPIMRPV